MTNGRKIRVLIVDDSAIVRKVLSEALSAEPDIEVVGTAPDPFIARDKVVALKPDVLTLDIEMPRMDGLTFLKRLMHFQPMPVIVISSLGQSSCRAAVEALESGAIEVLAKPGGPYSVGELRHGLANKIRAASQARLRPPGRENGAGARTAPAAAAPAAAPARVAVRHKLIAIGASTGGTEAIAELLRQVPAECPPILVVQHIPPVFSRAFAERLNSFCRPSVREAAHGDAVRPGQVLVAPGDFHMVLRRSPQGGVVEVKPGPQVCYQRPSVDVLFRSVAAAAGADAVGVLLTGMGADGAQGLLAMRQAGAHTIAQDEATSVVFGMPREAIRLGAAERVLPLGAIGHAIAAGA